MALTAPSLSRRVGIFVVGLALLGCLCPVEMARAQTPAADSATAPAIELSAEQKQAIYQSVSSTQKNSTSPTGFRAAVGAHVPDAVELQPMPATLATLIPAARDMQVAMIEKEVVLVDPKSRTITAVVTHTQ
jgi:endonuclease/exonuclease/phosphatase (EEP) superfamily protein YafD